MVDERWYDESFGFMPANGEYRLSFELLRRTFSGCYFSFAGGWRLKFVTLHVTKRKFLSQMKIQSFRDLKE